MAGVLYAFITVLGWGTWLIPSQNIRFKNQQIKTFYVAAVNLVLATAVAMFQGFRGLSWQVFWLPFVGGLVWAGGGFMAFTATDRLGVARAYGIWSPLNVGVSILCGIVFFHEFLSAGPLTLLLTAVALAILIAGVLMIIFAKGSGKGQAAAGGAWIGLLAALGAGLLWGSYFIPIKLSAVSMWVAAFPMAVGIFAGSTALVLLSGKPVGLNSGTEYWRTIATGVLWVVGNYGSLLLIDTLGAGRGFTIAQLGIVVNGLLGIFLLRDPQPKSKAAFLTLAGCVLACAGGILLGSLK
ncbi:MAG TPA: GRP family sugar transporter [Anaerolineales bacterium]|nr:GRP family sugar transporter [Anaerolineales bacterium]